MIAMLTALFALAVPSARAEQAVSDCAAALKETIAHAIPALSNSSRGCADFKRIVGCDPQETSGKARCDRATGLPTHAARIELIVQWFPLVGAHKEVRDLLMSGQLVDASGALQIESLSIAAYSGALADSDVMLLTNLFAIASFVVPDPPAW